MDLKSKLAQFAQSMKNTYVKQDIGLRTTVIKSDDDGDPKSVGANFSIKLNLIEVTALCAGALLLATVIDECRDKVYEARAMKKLVREQQKKCEQQNKREEKKLHNA